MSMLSHNIAAVLFAVLLVGGAFGTGVYGVIRYAPAELSAAAASAPRVTLADKELIAKSAVLYDIGTHRVLYQKNAYEQLPLASLTKLMAIQTILSRQSPDTLVEITHEHLSSEGDSGLAVGQAFALRDLIRVALVASSNDAMEAAASSLGEDSIARMNEAAKALGLTKTHFFNATGLDVSERTSGAYGSAYDVGRLAAIFYNRHPDLFELTTRPEVQLDAEARIYSATTLPLQSIPGFVAAKTGYTDLAGGNLVAIFDLEPGLTVAAVALGSTREGRFSDVKRLIEAARSSL